jgi:hypothetical protein
VLVLIIVSGIRWIFVTGKLGNGKPAVPSEEEKPVDHN